MLLFHVAMFMRNITLGGTSSEEVFRTIRLEQTENGLACHPFPLGAQIDITSKRGLRKTFSAM